MPEPIPAPSPRERDTLEALSRELHFVVSPDGEIRAANARAGAVFGSGLDVRNIAMLGVDPEHVRTWLRRVAEADEPVDPFEVALVVAGKPATFVFRGAKAGGDIALVGNAVPDSYVTSLQALDGVMRELSSLHREADSQRRDLAKSNDELVRVNRELFDSNRGLVRLHAEVEEKGVALRRETDVKGRLVANVSHEFRTPLNSILGLSQLLLDRLDGDLTEEQEKQVRFIRTSAQSLSELVNDLLDLSKIEAGRVDLRTRVFRADEITSALRGMMRPLAKSPDVNFYVDEPPAGLELESDEGKISQILRNLVSNAFKFTERGTVRVCVSRAADDRVLFEVKDTGIGISPDDVDRIFREFEQVDSALQRRVTGTGLGLSLSRRLAEILGGTLTVESTPGEGSTFALEIPRVHVEVRELEKLSARAKEAAPGKPPVLVVEDHRQTLFLYERYLSSAGFQTLPARTVEEARGILERTTPAAIVLDVMLEGESTWRFLGEIKDDPRTRAIPVMVVTVVDRAQKARALGADEFWLKPIDPERLLQRLRELSRRNDRMKLLVIDDDEASRYVVRRMLQGTPYDVIEAADGRQGVELARAAQPQLILLDFLLGDQTAFEVLDDLKLDPATRRIPVIIQTSKQLDELERARLSRETAAILSKQNLSRELAIARIREALINAGVQVEVGEAQR